MFLSVILLIPYMKVINKKERDKNVWHLQSVSSIWRPLAFPACYPLSGLLTVIPIPICFPNFLYNMSLLILSLFNVFMSFSWRAILRNWARTVPRCAVLRGRAPCGTLWPRDPRVSWHPRLTEFLCLKHLQCLLVFSQFSFRLGDESPTGSWPEDKPKSPE